MNEELKFDNVPWPITVAEISDTEVTIKNNPEAGVQYAPQFKVFAVNKETNEMTIGHPLAGQTNNNGYGSASALDKNTPDTCTTNYKSFWLRTSIPAGVDAGDKDVRFYFEALAL